MSDFDIQSASEDFELSLDGSGHLRGPGGSDDGDGEEDMAIYSSASLPLMKDVIKRILKTDAMLKTRKEVVDGLTTTATSDTDHAETTRAALQRVLDLYHYLWGRLLRILNDEHERCADIYTHSLNLQDRMPFESLAHAIHHNTSFCELLGEITSANVEGRPYSHEELTDTQRDMLKVYYDRMEAIQVNATHCALMVVEGSRESFLDPISMNDLCKIVMDEPSRRKRLVPLSLMFSMLDQDEQSVGEALVQGVPRSLMQRLRHLVHRLFGPFPEKKERRQSERRTSPLRYHSAVIESEMNSPLSSARGSPLPHRTTTQNGSALPIQEEGEVEDMPMLQPTRLAPQPPPATTTARTPPDSPMPAPPATSNGTFPEVHLSSRKRAASAARMGDSPTTKRLRHSPEIHHHTHQEAGGGDIKLSLWQPSVGDKVGRGPRWAHHQQGSGCDFGEVVGFTDADEVLVRWIPSEDSNSSSSNNNNNAAAAAAATSSPSNNGAGAGAGAGGAGSAAAAAHGGDGGRLFRYKYRAPYFHVVSWADYAETQTMNTDKAAMRMTEMMLICAVVGVLCQQRDAILPALQFQTIESVVKVLDSVDLAAASHASETAVEASEMREKARLGAEEEDGAVDEDSLESMLRWDVHLQKVKRRFREERELIARAGWVLNALLSHKKLAFLFLEAEGLRRVMRILRGPLEVATAYGCAIVLAHLAKSSIFEEVLRNHEQYFEPIMNFILHQWQHSPSVDVQGSVAAFVFHSLSFPCVLQYFDGVNGASQLLEILEKSLKTSEEKFDVLYPGLQLAALKCLNTYVIAHLMLSTKVIFRKHRVLSALLTKASPKVSLPRDLSTIDSVLAFLACPNSALQDVSAENVLSLLAPDRLTALQKLVDTGFHALLLRCSNFYFIQSRWELLTAALQALCVLTVVPYIRPLVAEPPGQESGIAQLLVIVNDLSVTYHNGNSSRENHLLPCVVSALHVLINVMTPPAESADEGAVAIFNNICGSFRANDGVRTLLEILKIKKDSSLSAKLNFFPVIARAIHLMVILRRFGDTSLLFEALGVHRVSQDLLQEYSHVQREYISMMGPRKLHTTELDPAGRFMENLKCLMPSAFGGGGDLVKTHLPPADPLEMELRQSIVAKAVIDYSKESLLTMIASYLETEGYTQSAAALKAEGLPQLLPPGGGGGNLNSVAASADAEAAKAPPVVADKMLDGIVRSYLRQQQEKNPNPIETLPQFDLTKKHVFMPPPAPPDQSRNVFNRLLDRKMGTKFSLRTQINDNCLTYRYPSFMFDITGGDEGLQGESICFCDNGEALIIGTSEGGVAIFDTFPGDASQEKLLEQHIVFENEAITSLVVSNNGQLVAAVNEAHQMKIMPRDSLPVVRHEFPSCRAMRFAHDNLSCLVTSVEEHTCKLYDLTTQQEARSFNDRVWSGENMDNVAVFDASSQLVLHDAILWDLRCGEKPVFRFDRITESFASAFHPSNQMVIIDEKIWDLRSFRMLQTVPAFQKATSFHLNHLGRVIYSFRQASLLTSTPILSAVDSYSLEVIFSEESQPAFKAFALDPSDRYCAATLDTDMEAVIRLYATSSGPFPDHNAFSSPRVEQDNGSDLENDDEDEDEIGEDWSIDDEDEDDFDDEDEEESSANYTADEDDEDDDDFASDDGSSVSRSGGGGGGGGNNNGANHARGHHNHSHNRSSTQQRRSGAGNAEEDDFGDEDDEEDYDDDDDAYDYEFGDDEGDDEDFDAEEDEEFDEEGLDEAEEDGNTSNHST